MRSDEARAKYATLQTEGVVVIRIFPPALMEWFQQARMLFVEALHSMPEFVSHERDKYHVGGFAALGNASSFHHPTFRALRYELWRHLSKVARAVAEGQPRPYLRAMFDRILSRPAGETATKESFHQDIHPAAVDGTDVLYGGWFCLNENENDTFSCIKRTQNARPEAAGFAKMTAEDVNRMFPVAKFPRAQIPVPPGCAVLFNQRIVHEVHAKKARHKYRIFHCVHASTVPFTEEQLQPVRYVVENQAVPRLPSGQEVTMYGKIHVSSHQEKMVEFAHRMHPSCKEVRTLNLHGVSRNLLLPKQFMPSMRDLGCMYSPYEPYELVMLGLPMKVDGLRARASASDFDDGVFDGVKLEGDDVVELEPSYAENAAELAEEAEIRSTAAAAVAAATAAAAAAADDEMAPPVPHSIMGDEDMFQL